MDREGLDEDDSFKYILIMLDDMGILGAVGTRGGMYCPQNCSTLYGVVQDIRCS